jgi:hypothetical protein
LLAMRYNWNLPKLYLRKERNWLQNLVSCNII